VRAHLFNIIYFIGSYAQFPTDSLCVWYEILWAVQVISHYRIFVTIKYDQHSRTLMNELTQGLKKQLDDSSSFVSVLFAVSPNSFKI
jgi:hypothetical protein